ncbi:hypothetical protein D8674_019215 [Pyrus ussuriensis x Pyrus communis]|uniref:Uncharacterized protein n=1 Tax=Pyrus ussuriensis x Pyrus communis TaxID=2448454 RepID=A0A5N5G758_9ROSA|nr:hypothetical protein D8674_019215 [Pyrus ussuriensis x Pyrus communis]
MSTPPLSPKASVSTAIAHGLNLRLRKLRALLKGLWVLAQGTRGNCAGVLGLKGERVRVVVWSGSGLGLGEDIASCSEPSQDLEDERAGVAAVLGVEPPQDLEDQLVGNKASIKKECGWTFLSLYLIDRKGNLSNTLSQRSLARSFFSFLKKL